MSTLGNWARAVAVALVGWAGIAAGENNTVRNVDIGKDPRAYKTALEMHKTAPDAEYGPPAAALTRTVTEALERGKGLESDQVWKTLLLLELYRKSPEVQALVPDWVNKAAATAKRGPASVAEPPRFREGNKVYGSALVDAADHYRMAVTEAPAHMDARNNLALSQMHLNHDLVAQIELEVLRRNHADYLPALINLTVVYERLGLFDRAKDTAVAAASREKELAAVIYNDAWYRNVNGDWNGAIARIAEIAGSSTNKHKQSALSKLSAEQYLDAGGVLRKGMARICGSRRSNAAFWGAIVVSVLGATALVWLTGTLGSNAGGSNRGAVGFWVQLPLAGLWFVLMWGCPVGAWWLLAIACMLAAGGVSAVVAEKR